MTKSKNNTNNKKNWEIINSYRRGNQFIKRKTSHPIFIDDHPYILFAAYCKTKNKIMRKTLGNVIVEFLKKEKFIK